MPFIRAARLLSELRSSKSSKRLNSQDMSPVSVPVPVSLAPCTLSLTTDNRRCSFGKEPSGFTPRPSSAARARPESSPVASILSSSSTCMAACEMLRFHLKG